MENRGHVALYRKYRPSTFDEVKNQDHVVHVLRAMIDKDAIPHALLFTGVRGTGKTTLARIFASAVGVAPEDIYEIDAASYNGVDSIRELSDAVYSAPFRSKYKVYIMDEVHMLSKAAWNAFLKTLEEPPAHVIFVLATTELDKVIDTALSRCQVFHLASPTRADIQALVQNIVSQEGVTLDADAAELIAVAANGSFRDALSITQKVLIVSGDNSIDADEVAKIIGAPRIQYINDLLESIAVRDVNRALEVVHKLSDAHIDMGLFMKLLIERVRTIMLYRGTKNDAYITTFNKEEQELYKRLGEGTSNINSRSLARLIEASGQTGATHIATLPLELAVIDLCVVVQPKTK